MPSTVQDLRWLAGTWRGDGDDAVEHWLEPRGGAMVGINHAVHDGETVSVEAMLISDVATPHDSGPRLDITLPRTGRQMTMRHQASGEGHATWIDPDDPSHHLTYTVDGSGLLVTLVRGDRTIEMGFRRVG